MVIVSVLGLGRLGGNIAGDLAFHGHTVRVWDAKPEPMDKMHERLAYEKKRLKQDGLMARPDFLVCCRLSCSFPIFTFFCHVTFY